MSYALIDTTDLTALGDAIRAKTSTTATMSVSAMADAVDGISVGSGSVDNSPVYIQPTLAYWNDGNKNYWVYNAFKDRLKFRIPLTNIYIVGEEGKEVVKNPPPMTVANHLSQTGMQGMPNLQNFWSNTLTNLYASSMGLAQGNQTPYEVDLSNITIQFDLCGKSNASDITSQNVSFQDMFLQSSVRRLPKFRVVNDENYTGSLPAFRWYQTFCDSLLLGIDNDTFDSKILAAPVSYGATSTRSKTVFYNAKFLRYIPDNFLASNIYTASTGQNPNSNNGTMPSWFTNCYWLKKIIGCPFEVGISGTPTTYNRFANTFDKLYSLHHLTFYKPNNQVGAMYATNQIIDLSTVGYWGYQVPTYNYAAWLAYFQPLYNNELIPIDESMINDNDIINKMLDDNSIAVRTQSDTTNIALATYNRQSAIETINSLPDTSTAGGGNTIKFKSGAGSAYGTLYDMDELTAAEIAVATAKGWTVSLV